MQMRMMASGYAQCQQRAALPKQGRQVAALTFG